MAYAKERLQSGISGPSAQALGGGGATIAATGSAIGDAAVLTASMAIVSGADGTKGVKLDGGQPGDEVWVFNNAASALKLYPQNSSAAITLSGTGLGTAAANISVTAQKAVLLKCQSITQWIAIISA